MFEVDDNKGSHPLSDAEKSVSPSDSLFALPSKFPSTSGHADDDVQTNGNLASNHVMFVHSLVDCKE